MTARPLHQQYIIYKGSSGGGGGEDPDPATYCPANGYELPPDPEVFCHVNGYDKTIPEYEPDPDIPEVLSPEGSITLIVSNEISEPVQLWVTRSAGGFTYKIYGELDALIDQGTSTASSFLYDFTSLSGGYGNKYFKVIFEPVSGTFTALRGYSTSVLYPIIEIYLNTPSLQIFNFDNFQILKKVWMCETMDSLNTPGNTYKVFQKTYSLEQVTFPSSMAANTSMQYWFNYSGIQEVVFPAYMPNLSTIQYLFNYAQTKKITLPTTANVNQRMDYSFANMPNIKELSFPDGFFGAGKTAFPYMTFLNSSNFEKIVFPEDIEFIGASGLFDGLSKLNTHNKDGIFRIKIKDGTGYIFGSNFRGVLNAKEIHYSGNINREITAGGTYCFNNSPYLKEVSLPNYMQNIIFYMFYGGTPSLKKVNISERMPDLQAGTDVYHFFCNQYHGATEQVSTCVDWGPNYHKLNGTYMKNIAIFNQPTLKLSVLSVYGSSNAKMKLEYIEVDWYNSVVNGGLLTINLGYCNLSESELNRIFAALPAAAGTIWVTGNPGALTCDNTIATANGWTVT